MKKLTFLLSLVLFLAAQFSSAQDAASENDLYNTSKVHEIRITFEKENWSDLLDSLRVNGEGMLVGNASVDGTPFAKVGVRYRGTRSFRIGGKRNSLQIKLDHKDDNLNYQGYRTLKLSNALRDPSMVREVAAFELLRKYMPAPKAAHTKVFINDEYYGLFVNIEAVDEVFLKKHFGTSDNTLVKADFNINMRSPRDCKQNIFGSLEHETNLDCYAKNFELKSATGWKDLQLLTDVLNNHSENIENILDVDNALWMLAFNNVVVNLSSYTGNQSQNFYLYRDKFGRFNPILWDLNLAFGSYKNTGNGSDLEVRELQRLDPLLHEKNPSKPLISQLLKNPTYRKIYLSHIRTILRENFSDDSFDMRLKELQAIIKDAYIEDNNNRYTEEDLGNSLTMTIGKRSKIPGLSVFMGRRARFLLKHDQLNILPPEVAEVKVKGREKFSNEMVKNFKIQAKINHKAKQVRLFYRYDAEEDFKMILLKDDGNSHDENAGDQIFGGMVAGGEKNAIEYFIVAENALSIGFDPPNYMYELHEANLTELNK